MALVLRDRVKETTSTAGTGTYTLAGAVVGFETFASVGNGNTTYYGCSDGTDFEVGIGTYTASGTTLARTTILQSSNSDSAVNWGTGTRTIFCTLPAEKMSFLDASGTLVASSGSALNVSSLTSASNGNIDLDPNGSGKVVFKGNTTKGSGQLVLNCEQNSHGITLKGPPHSANASYTLTLPNDDGSSGQTLATDGNGNLSWATAASGADLYAANESSPSAQPSATGTNAVAIGAFAVAAGADSVALSGSHAGGQFSFAAARGGAPGMSTTYGANGFKSFAIGPTTRAGSYESSALGNSPQANASQGMCYGRSGQINSNGIVSAILGGYQCQTNGAYATTVGGQSNLGNGDYSIAIGGGYNYATGDYSVATGKQSRASIYGQIAHSSGQFSAHGDAQGGQYLLRADTSGTTAEVLTTNNSTAAATNQIVAATGTIIVFDGTIVAIMGTNSGAVAKYGAWRIEGVFVNNNGTTSLVNSVITQIATTTGWSVALSADNTNKALSILCTGTTGDPVRWLANIRTGEVKASN